MKTPRLAAPLAVVGACCLLLASCSTSGGTATGTRPVSGEGRPPGTPNTPRTAAAATAATATATAAAEAATPEPATPEPATDGPAVISLPLDPYFLPPADEARLHTALDRLVADCLRSAGLRPPAPADAHAPALGRYERRYGLTSAAGARTTGYHLPDHPTPTQAPLSPAQVNALAGPQGCQESAARRITGTTSYPGDPYVVRSANQESFDRSAGAPEVVAAVTAWSRCMRRSGYDYATPLRTGTWPSERATDEERATALTDVACKQETGLVRIWNEAEATVQRTLIQQNSIAFEGVLTERRRMLGEADAVLARPEPGP
ncbi:hypothetical protein [Kitasatospora sp. NPDC005856]|uniref:hypothetical protein n=1 Tax=Kitasatospora sp. NPDC005856 TaxID=3154566 RepID=UPI0033CEF40C